MNILKFLKEESIMKIEWRKIILGVLLLAIVAMLSSTPVFATQPTCPNVNAVINPGNQNVPESSMVNGVRTMTVVTLNGTNSNPKDNVTCKWTSLSDPSIVITNSNSCIASFTAPEVDPNGASFTFRLDVTETQAGCTTETDFKTTVINVTNVSQNQPPVAAATATPADVNEGEIVTLDGTASNDPDGDILTSYMWEQTDGPSVTLSDSSSVIATFTAPEVPYPNGASLTFKLTVSDGYLTGSANTTVTVKWVNEPPVAGVLCPASVNEGAPVTLDGGLSTDDEDGIASFAWNQVLGQPNADLSGVDLSDSSISFTAPQLTSAFNTMKFGLTVTDNGGLTSSAECDITVLDVTPPVISGVDDITKEATSASGAAVSFNPTANDAVDGDVAVICIPESGSIFALGKTIVNCSASDSAGNPASASFTVIVQDTTPPDITGIPSDMTAEATGPSGAVVTYTNPTATDLVDGTVDVACVPASDSTFALGTTTVNCSASDKSGNKATASFEITIQDTTPPALTLPTSITAEATGPSGAAVAYSASATDLVDGTVDVACVPASDSTFALGTTTVNCSAKDAHDNTATGSFTITVKDTTPPVLTLPADITEVSTGASQAVVNFAVSANDLVDGAVDVSCSAASGATFPVGTTTVNCSATDSHGNTGTGSFKVNVVYTWTGFFQPVDNLPAFNAAKAGSAIPVKFSLTGNQGLNIIAAGYPGSKPIVCGTNNIVDTVEETVTAGSSSLNYDAAADQYIYVWKTDRAWAGSCRQLQVKLNDGSVHVADFKFNR